MTDDHLLANKIFHLNNFDTPRVIDWWVWAARLTKCPKCKRPPHKPCINMVDKKKGIKVDECRTTRWPHQERVDWDKLLKGLMTRGYWNGRTDI